METASMKPQFLIAATSSGCGKTTLTMGLLRALRQRSLRVQPFKCGPDYIDTAYHRQAAGCASVNLDPFMMSRTHVEDIYNTYAREVDVTVTEGVMGLYDGYDRWHGSSYEVSVWTDQPVVLVVNAASTAYSVAAVIHGFMTLRPDVRLAGVVFNCVSSPSHYAYLQEACRDIDVPSLGYLLQTKGLEVPSRHLGLTLGADDEMEGFIQRAAEVVENGIDIERLLEVTRVLEPSLREPSLLEPSLLDRTQDLASLHRTMESSDEPYTHRTMSSPTVAIARDEAFNFIYNENILAMQRECRTVEFSPLHDTTLPAGLDPAKDILYLPGGYPELYASELETNTSMRKAVKDFAEQGGRIYAECGGMIYLTQEVDGKAMCGVLPLHTTMKDARLHLGYRTVKTAHGEWPGHEFHYSRLTDADALPSIAQQYRASGKPVDTALYRMGNVIAGYTHLYWAERNFLDLWKE